MEDPKDNTPLPDPDEPAMQVVDQANLGNTVRASWPFSLDDIRSNIASYRSDAKEALIAAFLWCIDSRHPVAKPDFAKRVGYSDNVIYKLYTGKYMHPKTLEKMEPAPELVKDIKEFLLLEKERFEGGKTEFVMTPTARKVMIACDLARESQSPVFLWGPSHLGKSWALEYYTHTNNHGRTTYCRMKAASGLGGMVKRMATCLGISDKSNAADLIERIKRALTPNTLLILDELHQLSYTYRKESFFACLEVIREIYDEVQCGMVLCGTHLLLERVRGAQHAELEQLMRRGVHKVALPVMPTKEDLTEILKHNGLKFPAKDLEVQVEKVVDRPYEILRQSSKRDGLKAITERLRYGRKLASKAGAKMSWEHFVDAHLRIAKQAVQQGEWD